MKFIETIRRFLHNTSQSAQMAREIREGIENQAALVNKKMLEMLDSLQAQTDLLHNRLNKQIEIMNAGFSAVTNGTYQVNTKELYNYPLRSGGTFEDALKQHPLLFAPKTYNTAHRDYDARLVRNFPGKIFNYDQVSTNPVYQELKMLARDGEIPEATWHKILSDSLAEAKTVPHADQVFERKEYIEQYLLELERKHGAYYRPGWVNMDDALFLYWVVRRLKPKAIVQTGVCNGLSSAFMMLALARNGDNGTLHVIDMPPIFDSNDDQWKVRNKVYGVVIPEHKTSGWIVPDAYQDRFEVLNGDARALLPGLLEKVGKIDMFYHDSDHTYDHMMFEFEEAKKYLTPAGVIVSDDISWNASLWDFADIYKVPAYNYRGSMGIAVF